jgi:poly-beta-hydroxybutyrate-responsive repressor
MICGGRKRFENIGSMTKTPILIEQFIEPCILLSLLEKPQHGYAIIQHLKQTCLCDDIDIGNFYRILGRLKKENMIKSNTTMEDQRRNIYQITTQGKKFLNGWANTLEKNKELLTSFLQKYQEVQYV